MPSTELSIDQWLVQVEGALATHMEEAPSKARLQKKFFLMEQQKTESIDQFTGRVDNTLSDYVHYILAHMIIVSWKCSFSRVCNLIWGTLCGPIYEGGYQVWRIPCSSLWSWDRGSEGKIVSAKAKALTVEKVTEGRDQNELKDLRQQIDSLAMTMKCTIVGNNKPKMGGGVSSPRKKESVWYSPSETPSSVTQKD